MAQRPDGSTPGGKPPARSSWRKTGTTGGAAATRGYHWTRRSSGPPGRWRRRFVRYGVTAATALLIAVFIRYVFFIPIKTPLIAIAVSDYLPPFPPNAWAAEDLSRFARTWSGDSSGGDSRWREWFSFLWGRSDQNVQVDASVADFGESETNALGTLHQLLKSKKIRPGGPDKDVVMLYLSAHGYLNAAGEPCLLLGGAEYGDHGLGEANSVDSHSLKLSSLLKELGDSLAADTKKVVFLDSNRFDTQWPLGILYNGFADRLEQTVRDAKIDNLYLFNSAGKGEIGHFAPQRQASLFAYFLTAGLEQQADRNGDGTITLLELRDDVSARVNTRSQADWHEPQAPFLATSETAEAIDNVRLVWTKTERVSDAEAAGKLAADYDTLTNLWRQHAALQPWRDVAGAAAETQVATPRELRTRNALPDWEAFQQGLLRYEQVMLAGDAYRSETEALKSQLEALAADLAVDRPVSGTVAFSLPLARLWEPSATDEELNEAKHWLESPPSAAADAPPTPPPLSINPRARAQVAWNWVLAGAHPDRVRKALELAGGTSGNAAPGCIELHFLEVLGPGIGGRPPYLSDELLQDAALLQTALACRQAAEQAAVAAGDERVQYAVRDAISKADQIRRLAEDRLFVGAADLEAAKQEFAQAAEEYASAEGRAVALAFAYSTRDRGFSELPYLANWLTRRPGASLSGGEAIQQHLRTTIAEHQQLTDRLAQLKPFGSETGAQPDAALRELAAKSDADLRYLRKYYADAVTEASKSASDGQNLRDLAAVLSVPLVSGDHRAGLLKLMFDRLDSAAQLNVSAASPPGEADAAPSHPLLAIWSAIPHPLVQYLGLAPTGNAAAIDAQTVAAADLSAIVDRLSKQGEQVRARLAGFRGEIQHELRPATSDAEAQPAAIRQRRDQAVRLARTSYSLTPLPCRFGETDKPPHDPFNKLACFDRQQLLAWQGERTLDDFWGPDDAQDPEQTYFAQVSKAYLDAAQRQDPEPAPNIAALLERRVQAVEAAAEPLGVTIGPVRVAEGKPEVRTQVRMAPQPALPSGIATVYAIDGDGQAAAASLGDDATFASRLPVAVNAGLGTAAKPSRDWQLRLAPNADDDAPRALTGEWNLVELYRAHRRLHPFSPKPLELTRKIDWQPSPAAPPTLIVEGQGSEPGSIAIVLDCSGSMQEKEIGPGGRPEQRITIARQALLEILDKLSTSKKYEVSLWMYGHRMSRTSAGWNKFWGPEQRGVLPSEDVEPIVTRRLLDRDSLELFQAPLRRARAWGSTPLYLSMVRALEEDVGRAPANVPRRLIVITDGDDDVHADATVKRTEGDVKQAFRAFADRSSSPVYFDIVGCGVKNKKLLQDIVAEAGNRGNYYDLNNGIGRLGATLEKALGLYAVEIAPLENNPSAQRQRVALDQELELPLPVGRTPYVARIPELPSAGQLRFAVEGGERLVMRLERKNQDWNLVEPRYAFQGQVYDSPPLEGHPQSEPPDLDFDPPTFHLSALRPKFDGALVAFLISVQNGNPARFSPRPAESWVEIQPQSRAGNDAGGFAPYVFYDQRFDLKRPVPVLSCLASDWPSAADVAEISLFFKMHATPVTKSARIRDIRLSDQPDEDLQLKLQSGPTLKFAVDVLPVENSTDAWQVQVTEIHAPDDRNLASVKVALSYEPSRVTRRYFAEEGRVQHTFVLQGVRRQILDNYQLNLTTREDLERDAARVKSPIRALVPVGSP